MRGWGRTVGVSLVACAVAAIGCGKSTHFNAGVSRNSSFRREVGVQTDVRERVKWVLVGDTGAVRNDDDHINKPFFRVMRRVKEERDVSYMMVPGDLVYPHAPNCDQGMSAKDRAKFNATIGLLRRFVPTGAQALLALGNHDHRTLGLTFLPNRDHAAERCFQSYVDAEGAGTLVFPAPAYLVDLGVARVAVLNTVHMTGADLRMVGRFFEDAPAGTWTTVVAHHSPVSYFDKEADVVDRDAFEYSLSWQPDLWLAGHAHHLQLSRFRLPKSQRVTSVVTSGSGSKCRETAGVCTPLQRAGCAGRPGLRYAEAVHGYATLDVTYERVRIDFKDENGEIRYHYVVTPSGRVEAEAAHVLASPSCAVWPQ